MSIHRQEKQHERSELLSEQENNAIINGLGRSCYALSTAVVQLYLAEAPNNQRWNKRCCGVVCFVKDNPKRSYYIRVYDPKGKNLLWEQEIYNQFTYNSPREYFHTFEADDCQAALNFASEDEANKFKGVVENKLLERVRKRRGNENKRKKHGGEPLVASSNQNIINMGMINVGSGAPPAADVTLNKPAGVLSPKINKDKGKDKGRKRLTKDDIGTPTDFRHVGHVGWDPSTGLDMQKLDPNMKTLFEKVGIEANVNKETVDFIYDFVDRHGGLEALKEDLARSQGPTLPALPPGLSTRPPPPPFSRSTTPGRSGAAPPPTPPHRGGPLPHLPGRPPPPPPMRKGAPPPPGRPAASAPPPPPGLQGGNIPLPPPPPPGGPFMSRPPQGAAPPMAPSGGNRSGLLADIHRGKDLTHVEQESRNSFDARDGLLNQIRSGKTLKPVTQSEPASVPEPQGIVGALALALAQRSGAIHGSEDEDESDDDMDADYDDEWDD